MNLPETARTVIVGGAIVGSFCAWSLRKAGHVGEIIVVERDATYQHSSTALSAASIRTQFGTPVNVRMSVSGGAMFRDIEKVFGSAADIGFKEKGYLILGRPDQARERAAGTAMQCEHGAHIAVLDPAQLRARFPGICFDDVGIGTLGLRDEGWFDAWSLLALVRKAERELRVRYV